ncbi:hypothetical protein ACN28S_11250 [Cystobacter fuscus]
MPAWVRDAVVYHLYPLGMCGAPARNDFTSPPKPGWRGSMTGSSTCADWG